MPRRGTFYLSLSSSDKDKSTRFPGARPKGEPQPRLSGRPQAPESASASASSSGQLRRGPVPDSAGTGSGR